MTAKLRSDPAFLVAIMMAGGLVACAPSQGLLPAPAAPSPESKPPARSGETGATAAGSGPTCANGEETIFRADVEDDLGLSIALCIRPAPNRDQSSIVVRYSGEGGGRELSCIAMDCAGIIDFTHYRRPRFTILTLEWRDAAGRQRIVETFDAQKPDAEPYHAVTHSWRAPEKIDMEIEARAFPVISHSEPLALLRLGSFLDSTD